MAETDGALAIRVNPAKTLIDVSPLREATQRRRVLRFSSYACEAGDAAISGNLLDVVEQLVRHAPPSEFGIHDHTLYIAFAPGPLNPGESHPSVVIIDANGKGIATVCKELPEDTHICGAENIEFVSQSDDKIFIILPGGSDHSWPKPSSCRPGNQSIVAKIFRVDAASTRTCCLLPRELANLLSSP